jgi:uncharacterized membrane protein
MAAYEKQAWFNLAVLAATLALFVLMVPIVGLTRAGGSLGTLGLLGLGLIFVWPRRGKGVVNDERDAAIAARANLFAFAVVWLSLALAAWSAVQFAAGQRTISVDLLPLIVYASWFLLELVRATATLVLYHRGREHAAV